MVDKKEAQVENSIQFLLTKFDKEGDGLSF